MSDRLLQDPDTHWHIAVGRLIWNAGSVPWTDDLSHTFSGSPWIAKEWLSQLILFAASAAAGWWGVAVLTSVVLAMSFAWLFGWLRDRLHPTAALVMALVAVVLSLPHFLARPHIFALPALMLWTAGLVEAAERRCVPPWRVLPVMALWANLHASFTFGFVLAAILAAEAVFAARPDRRVSIAAQWALFLAASVLAACISPYGYHTMLVTFTLFSSGESLRYIQEWQPLAFDLIGAVAVATALLLGLSLALHVKQNAFRLLIVAFLTFMMFRHLRFISQFAIVAPMVAVGPLVRRFPALASPASWTVPQAVSRAALAALLAAIIALGCFKTPRPSPETTPAGALEAARKLNLAGPVYNDYDFGGYLISQGIGTFIDGRSDQLFLNGFMAALDRMKKAKDSGDFIKLLDRYGVTWALVRTGSDEVRHFDAAGWDKAYEDAVAVIYVRR